MGDQARARGLLLLGLMGLGGCVGGGGNEGLATFWDNATGRAMQRRGAPPGLDQPFQNLSQVPPRPARPDVATRDALTRQLQQERAGMDRPLVAGTAIPPPPPGNTAEVPLAPPSPANLRPAPVAARASAQSPALNVNPSLVPVPAGVSPRSLPADPGNIPPPAPPAALLAPPRALPADPGNIPPPPPSVR